MIRDSLWERSTKARQSHISPVWQCPSIRSVRDRMRCQSTAWIRRIPWTSGRRRTADRKGFARSPRLLQYISKNSSCSPPPKFIHWTSFLSSRYRGANWRKHLHLKQNWLHQLKPTWGGIEESRTSSIKVQYSKLNISKLLTFALHLNGKNYQRSFIQRNKILLRWL